MGAVGLMAMLLLGTGSCTDHFDELNTPDNVIAADNLDGALLGQAFAQTQWNAIAGDRYQVGQNLFADIYAQYFATTKNNFWSDMFEENPRWGDWWYEEFYGETAPQIYFVEQFTAENNMPVQNAVAKVWKVWMYHRVTDYYGPIIYSEFGSKKTSVPFDSQEEVYRDFFKTLDEAVAVLKQNTSANAFGSNDQVYSGDVAKWLTFANSLRLRLAMRVVYADENLAKTEAEKAVADGVMMTNEDNAGVLATTKSINNLSRWTYLNEFRMSASMESTLKGWNDPRLSEYFNEAGGRLGGNGGYHGIRNGLTAEDRSGTINEDHSFVDDRWLPYADGGGGATTPSAVMYAAEVYFLRAEGALRGWEMGGTAQELYNEGIRTSIAQWSSATPAEVEAYINSTATPVPTEDKFNSPAMTNIPVLYQEGADFETRLEQIITQKWLAVYPDGREAWAERRRTGYPRGYAVMALRPAATVARDELMRRLRFSRVENLNNAAAVEEAIQLLGGPDVHNTRLWWDAKPLNQFPTPTD
ncbi:hypothetical protein D770_23850 [Flammeovirgaceae bacterium 311]|nr:hypothetical protein D770_23850 [Flammeovirgaceae bacterium 311]